MFSMAFQTIQPTVFEGIDAIIHDNIHEAHQPDATFCKPSGSRALGHDLVRTRAVTLQGMPSHRLVAARLLCGALFPNTTVETAASLSKFSKFSKFK